MLPEQQFWVAMATLLCSTLLNVVGIVYGVKNAGKLDANKTTLDAVHVQTNSNLTKVIKQRDNAIAKLKGAKRRDKSR